MLRFSYLSKIKFLYLCHACNVSIIIINLMMDLFSTKQFKLINLKLNKMNELKFFKSQKLALYPNSQVIPFF